jgi:hypothetical protein
MTSIIHDFKAINHRCRELSSSIFDNKPTPEYMEIVSVAKDGTILERLERVPMPTQAPLPQTPPPQPPPLRKKSAYSEQGE